MRKIFAVVIFAIFLIGAVVMIRMLHTPTQVSPYIDYSKTTRQIQPTAVPTVDAWGTMTVTVDKDEIEQGETITATVNINTRGELVSGADAIVRFDPRLLDVVTPISTGTMFASYPRSTVDATNGVIKVTGFGVGADVGDSIFASVSFAGRTPGQTTIYLDFIPGATNLSTIAQKGTGKNILGRVEAATVEIL